MRWLIAVALLMTAAIGAYWRYGGGRLDELRALDWRQLVTRENAPIAGASAANGPAPAIAVDARPVGVTSVRREIEAVGSLRSNESVILRMEIAGRIAEILFDEGQRVRKGMPLIRLDAAVARAQVEQAKASLILSRANHDRAVELYRRGAGTERARDEAIAKLQADEAALALSQAMLGKAMLVAPFDGIVGLRRVSVGDYVNPGQDLVNIEDIESLKVDFRVPEIYTLQIRVGQEVAVRLDAVPGQIFNGKVYAVDPAYDPNGRAIILRASLPNRDGLLRSGMFARVALLIDEREDAIVVPESALVPVGQDHFVFRVVEGKALLTKVSIGQRRKGQVEIVDGLEKDSVVVVEGALKLRDGAAVRSAAAKAG